MVLWQKNADKYNCVKAEFFAAVTPVFRISILQKSFLLGAQETFIENICAT